MAPGSGIWQRMARIQGRGRESAVAQNGKPTIALVMAGGGARAAYQVGVLKAISTILPHNRINPFPILCGTSAGAINAVVHGVYATDFGDAVRRLNFVWKNFRVDQVFRSDAWGIVKTGASWLSTLMLAGLGKRNPQAL